MEIEMMAKRNNYDVVSVRMNGKLFTAKIDATVIYYSYVHDR